VVVIGLLVLSLLQAAANIKPVAAMIARPAPTRIYMSEISSISKGGGRVREAPSGP
jgi:hypothetical protein